MIPRAYRTERPATPTDPALAAVQARVDALLPAYYRGGAPVSATSMGSAGLARDGDGRVAWGRVWTSFCDLALAGGPPHRGTLLRPATPAELAAEPAAVDAVAAELARGLLLTTGRAARRSPDSGWLAVGCASAAEAAWLALAVTAENVSCRARGDSVELPLGPRYRVEKEVKNGVCSLAKACHYWGGHLSFEQQASAATLGLCEPATPADFERDPAAVDAARLALVESLRAAGLPVVDCDALGWVGLACDTDEAAGWKLRVVASSGVMCRREVSYLYVPAGGRDEADRRGRVCAACVEAWGGWARTQSARRAG